MVLVKQEGGPLHVRITAHPSHHVKKYPFNPKKKDWYFFSQKEEEVLRLLIPGWTEYDPMFATLKDIFIEEYGYSYPDYVNMTFPEIVEVVKRRRSEDIPSEIARIKSEVIRKFGAEGKTRNSKTEDEPQQTTRDNKARPQPLTKKARLIYDKLCALQPHEAMTLPEIQEWLYAEHRINLDEGTWKNIRKELLPYGLKNTRRIGYFLQK